MGFQALPRWALGERGYLRCVTVMLGCSTWFVLLLLSLAVRWNELSFFAFLLVLLGRFLGGLGRGRNGQTTR